MGKQRPLPPAATKCTCGHAFHEHVQGGEQHACQHGAQPPFTHMCKCKKFRTKEEELAQAELKRQSRRDRGNKKPGPALVPSPAAAGPQTAPATQPPAEPMAEATATDPGKEKPLKAVD